MTLSFDDMAGGGPAVVLLHSTVCDRGMWDPQLPALTAAGYRLVRCDLRGFGETPMPSAPYNEAQDVMALLDQIGISSTVLIAASGGGRVALEIAARWPERIVSLALLSTGMSGHEPGPRLRAFGEREDELLEAGEIDAAAELNVDTWLGPHATHETRDKVREMQRHAFEVQLNAEDVDEIRVDTDLAAVTAPTLLISGAHDLPDFREIAVRLAKELRDARHIELDWAGHLPSLERPEALNPILIEFLAETAGKPVT